MKIYVLLRDGVPLGYALAAATHCALGRKPGINILERILASPLAVVLNILFLLF